MEVIIIDNLVTILVSAAVSIVGALTSLIIAYLDKRKGALEREKENEKNAKNEN